MIELEVLLVAVVSWAAGICTHALWANRKRELAAPVAPDLLPLELTEPPIAPEQTRASRSPFAPKPKLRPVEPPRAPRLKHWPTPIAEKQKPPAMVAIEPKPKPKPQPPPLPPQPAANMPSIEWGSR